MLLLLLASYYRYDGGFVFDAHFVRVFEFSSFRVFHVLCFVVFFALSHKNELNIAVVVHIVKMFDLGEAVGFASFSSARNRTAGNRH